MAQSLDVDIEYLVNPVVGSTIGMDFLFDGC
jgi:hypothetical protein